MNSSSQSRQKEQPVPLNCRRLPGRLNTADTAVLLGFQEHDIPVLIAAKLLTPLGRPAANAPKYFAAVEVVDLSQNREWLALATKSLTRHWSVKNARKKNWAKGSQGDEVAA
jgi:hypothetical protein